MTTKYFKTNNPEILAAHATILAETDKLVEASKAFASQFNAKNIMSTSMTGRSFAGLELNGYYPYLFGNDGETREDKHLWTEPNKHNISRPRTSLNVKKFKEQFAGQDISKEAIDEKVKAAKADLAELNKKYNEGVSQLSKVDFEPFFNSFGTNWGDLMFSGLKWFELDGYVYFATGADFRDRMTEILGSEFEAADSAKGSKE